MKTLRMKFATDLGKTFIVSLGYAKDSLSAAEVETAMDAVIDGDIFATPLLSVAGAELVDRTVTDIL